MNSSIESHWSFNEQVFRLLVGSVVYPVLSVVVGPIKATIVTALLNGGNGDGSGGAGGACA